MKTRQLIFISITTGVIISLIYFFVKQSGCNNVMIPVDTTTVIDTTEIIDTIPYYDTIPVKPASTIIYVDVPADVDTAEILKKFFAHVFRDDTLKNDSNVFIRLQQEITENDVINQVLEVHDFENTMLITKEIKIMVPVPVPKLYIGAFSFFNETGTVIGGKLMYLTKKNLYISAGYGSKKTIYIDASIPIFNKRNKPK